MGRLQRGMQGMAGTRPERIGALGAREENGLGLGSDIGQGGLALCIQLALFMQAAPCYIIGVGRRGGGYWPRGVTSAG